MKTFNEQQEYTPKDHLEAAASQLLKDGKQRVNQLYKDGLNKVDSVEDDIQEYSDQLLRKVQENPLASVLIAAGVGFLLSRITKN